MEVFITDTQTVFPPDFNTTVAYSPVIGIRLFNTRFKVRMKHHLQPISSLHSSQVFFALLSNTGYSIEKKCMQNLILSCKISLRYQHFSSYKNNTFYL